MILNVLSHTLKAGLVPALALFILAAPLSSSAAGSDASGEITTTSSDSTKPTLRGEAEDIKKVTVTIYKEDSEKVLYQKKNVRVKSNGDWSAKVSKRLDEGTYEVKLTTGTSKSADVLDTETLTIGEEEGGEDAASGKITTTSSDSTKPTLRGEAEDIKKVTITVYKEDSTKKVFQKKNIRVKKNGDWSAKVSKRLAEGTYDMKLTTGTSKSADVLDTETLTIGEGDENDEEDSKKGTKASSGSVTVTTLPLLMGGTVRNGESVPVAYLQLRNTGKEAVQVEGFTVKQQGTLSTNLITGLSTVDERGESRTYSKTHPFKDGSAFVPSTATVAPGGFKLFTIKANMAGNISASFGKNLKLDVTGVQTNGSEKVAYPLRGTTWTVGF